jgi:hypothetical protein
MANLTALARIPDVRTVRLEPSSKGNMMGWIGGTAAFPMRGQEDKGLDGQYWACVINNTYVNPNNGRETHFMNLIEQLNPASLCRHGHECVLVPELGMARHFIGQSIPGYAYSYQDRNETIWLCPNWITPVLICPANWKNWEDAYSSVLNTAHNAAISDIIEIVRTAWPKIANNLDQEQQIWDIVNMFTGRTSNPAAIAAALRAWRGKIESASTAQGVPLVLGVGDNKLTFYVTKVEAEN